MRSLAIRFADDFRWPVCSASSRQRGISLVELMVGMALGLMLLVGVVSVTIKINAASAHSVKVSRLNQQMRSTLDFIVRDLQRAGYVNWQAALQDCPSHGDALVAGGWTVTDFYECVTPVLNDMGQVMPESLHDHGSHCILYSYDIDGDGGRSSGDFELFGFKLAGQAVRTRTAGNNHSCDSGTWQAISDAEIIISELTFRVDHHPSAAAQAGGYRLSFDEAESYAGWNSEGPVAHCVAGQGDWLDDKCLWRRTVTIELVGSLASEPDISMTLRGSVKLRNDHLQREPMF